MERQIKGWDFILLALTAFGGLGIEAIYAYALEPLIYGAGMGEWGTGQIIAHWCITCVTWCLVAIYILWESKHKYGFDLFMKAERIPVWKWIAAFCCVAFVLFFNWFDWGGIKIVLEFQKLGILKFFFQYLYYAVETVLCTLIIVYGQKACETWFHKENIPYGGIVVALTWGMAHWFTKGSLWTGIGSAICGFSYGIVYLLMNRNIRWSYLLLLIMFCL